MERHVHSFTVVYNDFGERYEEEREIDVAARGESLDVTEEWAFEYLRKLLLKKWDEWNFYILYNKKSYKYED